MPAVFIHAESGNHGKITTLSAASTKDYRRCSHNVPEEVCTQCNPGLVGKFKEAKDWCGEHGVPESQCFKCHPDLTFDPLPDLPEGADVTEISHEGEDAPDSAGREPGTGGSSGRAFPG